ncbi:MAG: ubiquinone biosynthesis protein UbiD [Dehalococcoidia bacterium]|nr:ubiquinone biosynthesis protein UbiD [Dehalococcoidia bacterium]
MADLRDWLREVEKREELKTIEGAGWDLDIGFLTAYYWKQWRDAPNLLFDKIPGYPPGFRVMSNVIMTPKHFARAFGLSEKASDKEMMAAVRQRMPEWEAKAKDFAPRVVKSGPVMENVVSGDAVDLERFPSPKWHELDGGRYLGTGCAVITQDPDTGEVNLGCYRNMVLDKKTVGLEVAPGKHGRLHYEKYHARGKPCPVAISIGHHPLYFALAGVEFPLPEYLLYGAITGKPAEVIQEEVTGLPIPADSEMVIVGWCPPGQVRPEGPFGEYTGYYASKGKREPFVVVERVYYRNNPIILGAPPGRPPNGFSYLHALMRSLVLESDLRKSGIPDIVGVWTHDSPGYLFITISIKQRYAGHAKQVGLAARHLVRTGLGARYIVVVDDDIDVTSISDVLWALTTRSDPEKHIDILRRVRSTSLDPMIRKPAESFHNSTAIIEACRPYEWMSEFPEAVEFSPGIEKKMMAKWGKVLP